MLPMPGNTLRLAQQLEKLTGLESRVSILGYVQRGGTPSAADRLLATRLGTAARGPRPRGPFGVMVAARGDGWPRCRSRTSRASARPSRADHPWAQAARHVGTCLGD